MNLLKGQNLFFKGMALLLMATPLSAYAFNFTEFGVLNLSMPTVSKSSGPATQISPGISLLNFGISLGFRIIDRVEFEPGLVYLARGYYSSSGGSSGTHYSLASIVIPLVIRYWITENTSIGVGPYFANGMGLVTVSNGSTSSLATYKDLSLDRDDSGLVLSVRYKNNLTELISLVLDERFALGLSNRFPVGVGSFQSVDFQSWFGIGFIL